MKTTNRRDFLRATAMLAAPLLLPASVFGQNAPSNRINVGIIGCGNQSTVDLPAFLGHDDVQVMAVCDVNTASYGYKDKKQFLGRKPGQEKVNAYYASKAPSGQYQGCDACNDFREVLQRPDIDAVAVIVPDHWHAIISVMAAKAGKDVYCEKPLALTVEQGQQMIKATRQHKRILQVGSHLRASPLVRHACELVRNGRIGQVKRVVACLPPNNAIDPGPGWKPMPVPEGFDYEMWLGPAPAAPYHLDRCLYRFRFIFDYSGGQVTNFGAHDFNIVQWALGTDDTGPVEFEDCGAEWPPKGSLFNTATRAHFRARYASGVELECETREPGSGCRFEGTKGWLQVTGQALTTEPASIKDAPIGPNEIHLAQSNPQRKENTPALFIPDHVRNFLDSVKSRQDPVEPVEVGHRMTNICHLGNIAMLLKRKIKFDPKLEQILGDSEAAKMLSRPLRGTWRY